MKHILTYSFGHRIDSIMLHKLLTVRWNLYYSHFVVHYYLIFILSLLCTKHYALKLLKFLMVLFLKTALEGDRVNGRTLCVRRLRLKEARQLPKFTQLLRNPTRNSNLFESEAQDFNKCAEYLMAGSQLFLTDQGEGATIRHIPWVFSVWTYLAAQCTSLTKNRNYLSILSRWDSKKWPMFRFHHKAGATQFPKLLRKTYLVSFLLSSISWGYILKTIFLIYRKWKTTALYIRCFCCIALSLESTFIPKSFTVRGTGNQLCEAARISHVTEEEEAVSSALAL